ncbi:hypothetical protein QJQ45_002268 [Haematococcus lacustris]|nr:hypothetical protein QJQ45_002268 [Haematococcus lacustris]
MDERCRRGQGPEAGSATDAPSAADAPAPAPSLLDLPAALLEDIASRAVQLGAGGQLSLTCRAFSLANLLHAPGLHIQLDRQRCDQLLTPRFVAALVARTSTVALTLYDEVLDHVMAKLGSCAAVEACKLSGSGPPYCLQPLDCTPGLAQGLLGCFPGLTALSLHGFSVTCSGLASLLFHPQLALQLQRLDFLYTCILQPDQPGPEAVVPANLFHGLKLKQLSLPDISYEDSGHSETLMPDLQPLAQHLTELSLQGIPIAKHVGMAALLRPLVQLQVLTADMYDVQASLFESVRALPKLHTLQLPMSSVEEDFIDKLLAITQITSLMLGSIANLDRSRADVPCSWQRLELTRLDYTTAKYLPLHSLTQPLMLYALDIEINAAFSPEVEAADHDLAHPFKVPIVSKVLGLDARCYSMSTVGEAAAVAPAMAPQLDRKLEQVVAMLQSLKGFATDMVSLQNWGSVSASDITALAPVCQGCTRLEFSDVSSSPSLEFWRQLALHMPTVQRVTFYSEEFSAMEAMCEPLQLMAEEPWARWLDIIISCSHRDSLPACCHAINSRFNDPHQPARFRVSFE